MAGWASALGLAACLALTRARAGADTFTHKKTRQELKGKLLGSVTRDGRTLFMVRLESGDARYLPEADWEVTQEKPKVPDWPKVTYNGKPREAAWLERQYQKFKDKITIIGGKYYDISSSHLWATDWARLVTHKAGARYKRPAKFAFGECARASLRVLRVLGPSELIGRLNSVWFKDPGTKKEQVRSSWSDERHGQVIHVKGVPTERVVTDATVNCGPLLVVGTHEWWSADRGARTIFSCRPLPAERAPLTRAQFAQALRSGFPLTLWKQNRKRAPRQGPAETIREPGPGAKQVWVYWWERVPVE